MKNLHELNKNERALITRVNAFGDLRERFISFGISKGSDVTVKNCSANRKNIEIDVDGIFMALRQDEAKLIEVEVYD